MSTGPAVVGKERKGPKVYELKEPRGETQEENQQTHMVNPERTRNGHMKTIVLPQPPARERARGQEKPVRATEPTKMNWLKAPVPLRN